MKLRSLPDTNHSLYDSRDFIVSSPLARKAFLSEWKGITLGVHALIDAIDRLSQSCHLAEFTDHGLPHLCSLIDRISHWTLRDEKLLVHQLNPNEAAILLVATLIHDMGMLSQKAEDLPIGVSSMYQKAAWSDIAAWVRKTHVLRLEGLVGRLLNEMSSEEKMSSECISVKDFQKANSSDCNDKTFLEQAITVASAHGKWPRDWVAHFEKYTISEKYRLRGLAAVVAVSDLLDEDSARCDTQTLLHHRHGTPLNIAHWLRHQLTDGRIMVEQGGIAIRMTRFCESDESLKPVYDALRNHFRLVLVYEQDLNDHKLNAGVRIRELHPATGIPDEMDKNGTNWKKLKGFSTEPALCYQLLNTFMEEVLKKDAHNDASSSHSFAHIGLEDIDLSQYRKIEGDHEILSHHEKTFRAIINDEFPESLKLGFDFLREEAKNAHLAGDGILVSHIIDIASAKCSEWVEKSKDSEDSEIKSQDIEWLLAMKLHWGIGFVDIDYDLRNFRKINQCFSGTTDSVSKLLVDLILDHFERWPCDVDISKAKEMITREWIDSDAQTDFPARRILLALLIEYSWHCNSESNYWHELLDHVISILAQDSSIQNLFIELKERLHHQRDLISWKTSPKSKPLSSVETQAIEDAYKSWLNVQLEDLKKSFQAAQSRVDFQSPYYSAWYSLERSTVPEIKPDSYETQISRWFMYRSANSFERYLTIIEERISQKREEATDYKYSDAIPTFPPEAQQIALLWQMEIHALRKWDFVRYRYILQKKAKCLMEKALSESSDTQRASLAFHVIHAFILSMKIPEKDKRFQRLFYDLAFGNPEYYETIIEMILRSPKREWVRLAHVFKLLGDAIPESFVERVIQWYIQLENTPLGERWGNKTYLNEMVSAASCSHDTEQLIDQLLDLYNRSPIELVGGFIDFVLKNGTKEQVRKIWSIQHESSIEILWDLSFKIIQHRPDLRDDLLDWMEENCPDDPNSRHNLSQVRGIDSSDETLATRDHILDEIEKSFDKLDDPNDFRFRFYGTLPWPEERVLPLLDKIEWSILDGKCHPNRIYTLLGMMSIFSEGAEGKLLQRLSEVCSNFLKTDHLPVREFRGPDLTSRMLFGCDPEGTIVRLQLSFAENLFNNGGKVETDLLNYLRKNYVSLIRPSNVPFFVKCILKLIVKHCSNDSMLSIMLVFLEMAVQSLFVEPNEYTEIDVSNVVRVCAVLFNKVNTNQYILSDIADKLRRDQILEIIEEMLQNAAQSVYPSARSAACEILVKWKALENTSSMPCIPEPLHNLFEKLKNDPHARVRFACEELQKRVD